MGLRSYVSNNIFLVIMKEILIISQVRMGSTRLPGKVLKKILDKPMLYYLVKRITCVKTQHKFILAIADSDSNQPLIDFAKKLNLRYFIGSEEDVLDRTYMTAKQFSGDIIVRITSDCPLTDPEIIDRGLNIYLSGDYDYISNVHPPTYPAGFGVEIFSFKTLETAWKEAKKPFEREHVTPYIWKNPNKFIIKNFRNTIDLSNLWLTVDTYEDFLLISKIIEHFHHNWISVKLNDMINYLKENPELLKINYQYKRNKNI